MNYISPHTLYGKIGVNKLKTGSFEFRVWAPFRNRVQLRITGTDPGVLDMEHDNYGYWSKILREADPGIRYKYILDNYIERPDPASHFQPEGVHSESQIIDQDQFVWEDGNWETSNLSEMIIYEVHVGLFTLEGTFRAAVPRLDEIKATGINAIEIMPVAQYPGTRNWGYDGVYPFSVQNSYGGPSGLKHFVNECHKRGINVILDVVYNHLGPEGNYLGDYGPYFTDKYGTPWGDAVNFDGRYSDHVRNYFIQNAMHWFENYHIDALRLDAVHAIFDMSAYPFLEELNDEVKNFSKLTGKKKYMIAESALNDVKIIKPKPTGGYGYDAQWSDDLHHSLHALITGERNGYYMDYGKTQHLVKALKEGFVYSGQFSEFRKKKYGSISKYLPSEKFIVFSQNHDQTGNRMNGERLSALVDFEALKLVAGVVILSPNIPLLFMGEEYGEESPFLYFISHSDPDLVGAVREGRKAEFREYIVSGEPPDPQSVDTFTRSRINWDKRYEGKNLVILDYYKQLIDLRNKLPSLSNLSKDNLDADANENKKLIRMRRWCPRTGDHIYCIFNLNDKENEVDVSIPGGSWKKVIDSSDKRWMGAGTSVPDMIYSGLKFKINAFSMAMYRRAVNSGIKD